MHNTALARDDFSQALDQYGEWRRKLADAIEMYQEWYEKDAERDSDDELRLYELVEALRTDKLTIALVGEFSRGKTELINAIFFADYQRRLLPSTPGRTTMCPTEIGYDPEFDPCIRLLPIETRKSGITIAEQRKARINWTTLPLDLDSEAAMADNLLEILKSKKVSYAEAKELALLPADDGDLNPGREYEIPVWRHAIINYPHPLLKQGLVILDTPGLNALGAEPELTFGMLSEAHAILFVLAADTGVTRTDLDVWKNYVCAATHKHRDSRIAALNKIDTLWDDLNSEVEIAAFINRQAEETRRLLEIPRSMVFPVSAKKGLVGKVRSDGGLVQRSGLPRLEAKLSEDMISYKQNLIRGKIVNEIGAVVEAARSVMQTKMDSMRTERTEILSLRGKSGDVIGDMTTKLLKHRKIYNKEVQSFDVTRRLLADQIRDLLRRISMHRFDRLVDETRESMHNSWTTQGLRHGIARFFKNSARSLEEVEQSARKICNLVSDIYGRFHSEHGLPRMEPAMFSVAPDLKQFDDLHEEAEMFRNSASIVITEQHFVIKKFFITMASRARNIFQECNTAARNWSRVVLTPIYTQIQEHKIMIDRRLENLKRLRDNHATLGERVTEIEQELKTLQQQAVLIDNILNNLNEPPLN